MKIAVPKECRRGESRVAVSPEVVKKLIGFGFSVAVEKGAGIGTSFTDAAYKQAGARIAGDHGRSGAAAQEGPLHRLQLETVPRAASAI